MLNFTANLFIRLFLMKKYNKYIYFYIFINIDIVGLTIILNNKRIINNKIMTEENLVLYLSPDENNFVELFEKNR